MKKIACSLLCLATLAGCLEDDRNYNMVDDSFAFTARQTLIPASLHTGSCLVGVAKNGKGLTAASATVSAALGDVAFSLQMYNTKNKTDYTALPEGAFTLSETVLDYGESDVVKEVRVSWDPVAMAAAVEAAPDGIIPLILSSDDLMVNGERRLLLIKPVRTAVSVTQKQQVRTIDRKSVEKDKQGRQPKLQETVTLDLVADNAITGVGMEFPVAIDNSLIAEFNKDQETPFEAAPEGLVTLTAPKVSIPEGGQGATFQFVLDKSLLMENGKLVPFPDYVVPVRLDKDQVKATRKGEAFDLKALAFGNMVTYVTVRYHKSTGDVVVTREWGRYSTKDAAWSGYISGFTANADRNVTLDGEYIYIAETNKTKNLWAISTENPAAAKKLPVGTVREEGTFYLSCPRVIPNDNAAVNGGKPVLVVSNMSEGEPTLYVYDKGVTADPTPVTLNTYGAGRRLGDTFTWFGSFQKGMLLFKDFNTAQGTVTFKLNGTLPAKLNLMGRLVAPPVSGAGAYFPYPDNLNAGICSVRGNTSAENKVAWFCTGTKDLWTLESAFDTPHLEQMAEEYTDAAFRFFEFNEKRYVAHTRQAGSTAGYFYVVEGKAGEAWDAILRRRDVIYQAAIQNDSDQENLLEEPSPLPSGHSGMDLDVFVGEEEVLIAVVKQNVGLSLFKMKVD